MPENLIESTCFLRILEFISPLLRSYFITKITGWGVQTKVFVMWIQALLCVIDNNLEPLSVQLILLFITGYKWVHPTLLDARIFTCTPWFFLLPSAENQEDNSGGRPTHSAKWIHKSCWAWQSFVKNCRLYRVPRDILKVTVSGVKKSLLFFNWLHWCHRVPICVTDFTGTNWCHRCKGYRCIQRAPQVSLLSLGLLRYWIFHNSLNTGLVVVEDRGLHHVEVDFQFWWYMSTDFSNY